MSTEDPIALTPFTTISTSSEPMITGLCVKETQRLQDKTTKITAE